MASSDIPDSVRRLVADHVPSIERLEILLRLFESARHDWTVEEIEEQIRSTPESIRQNVSALVAARLLTAGPDSPSRFRFTAESPELVATVAELAKLYRARRVAVIELIYDDRRDAVRSFSDAFKLGKPHVR